ncbi:hypothetical protein AB1E18_016376 [Capra hircus]
MENKTVSIVSHNSFAPTVLYSQEKTKSIRCVSPTQHIRYVQRIPKFDCDTLHLDSPLLMNVVSEKEDPPEKCSDWRLAPSHPGAEPIVTAARFPAGARSVRHGDAGVRRRDAAPRDGQGRGRGGDGGGWES